MNNPQDKNESQPLRKPAPDMRTNPAEFNALLFAASRRGKKKNHIVGK
ncbi:hypothetical protein [Pantoea sp. ME81]|nr:hypothetical protein [Pantoea sp. ME81]